MTPSYRYRAVLHRVVDGDTYELTFDTGFHQSITLPVRLRGWDCPERNTKAGQLARDAAAGLLANAPLIVETFRTRAGGEVQSFARYVADVYFEDGRRVGEALAQLGHAVSVAP